MILYGSVYVEDCNKDSNALVSTIRAKKAFLFHFNTRSDMDVQLLISEIFKRAPLWDQRDQNHHNRFILDKLWDEVANELKTQRSTVRKKWKTLRDKFRKTLATIPKPKSGDPGGEVLVSWQYFESLKFLKDQFTPRMSSGNIPKRTETVNILTEEEEEDNFEEELLLVNVMSSDIEEEQDGGTSNLDSFSKQSSSSTSSSQPQPKKLKKRQSASNNDDVGQQLIAIETQKLNFLKDKQNNKQPEESKNLHFFKCLLPCLESLSNIETLAYQEKILQTTREFLTNLNSSQNYASLSPTTLNIVPSNQTQED